MNIQLEKSLATITQTATVVVTLFGLYQIGESAWRFTKSYSATVLAMLIVLSVVLAP